jgi:hypothetical protein
VNYEHAWTLLQDRLIACYRRCDDCTDPEEAEYAEDVQTAIGQVLGMMDEIEEEGFVRVAHCI